MKNLEGDKSDVQRELNTSFYENILNTIKRFTFLAYTTIFIVVAILILLHITNFLSLAYLEIQKFAGKTVFWFNNFCRYGGMVFTLAVSLYAAFRLIAQNRSISKRKEKNLKKIEQIADEISATQYSADSHSRNQDSWEKTIKDCWCSLDLSSLKLKFCKETISNKVEKSKAQLKEIKENMTRLEAKLSEERIRTADASSNTDLVFDLINDNVPSISSLSEQLTNKGSGESIKSKYNILQKVLEMENFIDLETKHKLMDGKKRVQVPPIQQWSMPKEIFSLGSLASSRLS